MIFANNSLRSLGFRGLHAHGFGGLPVSVRTYILDNNPTHPTETDSLINDNDHGIRKVPDFMNRWNDAVTLSTQVDQVRSDPASASLVQKEAGIASSLLTDLLNARTYHPGDELFGGRSQSREQGLTAALNSIDDHLNQYMKVVGDELTKTQQAIDARHALEEKTRLDAQAAADAKIQSDAAASQAAMAAAIASQEQSYTVAKVAQVQTTQAEADRATAAAIAVTQQAVEVKAKADSDLVIARAQEPQIAGMPLSTVLPIAGAGILVLYLMRHKPASVAPVQGYRRRRRSARRARR